MILAIDIGNTSIGLCGIEINPKDGYHITFSCKMSTLPDNTEDKYVVEMKSHLEKAASGNAHFEGAVISSVVPDLTEVMKNCVFRLYGLAAFVITSESDTGLQFQVEHPEKVGKDRLADAAWAAANVPLPAVVVDLGTATTLNVIDENACFLGGVICVGVNTGLTALNTYTAQLPEILPKAPAHVIGKTTDECMNVGAVVGTAAMIDGLTRRIETALGKTVSLILTGGFSDLVSSFCSHTHICDPHLLYKGMVLIYERTLGHKYGNS